MTQNFRHAVLARIWTRNSNPTQIQFPDYSYEGFFSDSFITDSILIKSLFIWSKKKNLKHHNVIDHKKEKKRTIFEHASKWLTIFDIDFVAFNTWFIICKSNSFYRLYCFCLFSTLESHESNYINLHLKCVVLR